MVVRYHKDNPSDPLCVNIGFVGTIIGRSPAVIRRHSLLHFIDRGLSKISTSPSRKWRLLLDEESLSLERCARRILAFREASYFPQPPRDIKTRVVAVALLTHVFSLIACRKHE
jgi:hypothetical protein